MSAGLVWGWAGRLQEVGSAIPLLARSCPERAARLMALSSAPNAMCMVACSLLI